MIDREWSVPETDVIASIRDLLEEERPAVVATVVDVEGSAYRRPGAKMVVEQGGGGRGHITAGCLEDDVLALADDVLAADEPRVETYDLMNDEDDVWGLGVGCNGIIDVLLEPVDSSYEPVATAIERGEPIGIVTGLDGDVELGARAYYRDGSIEMVSDGDGFPEWLATVIAEPAAALVEAGRSDSVTVETDDGTATVFVGGLRPPPHLVVFGTGYDVGPVVELARKNGFRVTVVGFRGAVDLTERFPAADERVSTSPAAVTEALSLDAETYAVVMTHNFVDDRLTVDELLSTAVPYVGLMGPRERFEEMLEEFDAEGRRFEAVELERLYTPVGLDLGTGSPYGIAQSIVSEVLAVANGREPRHLDEREGPIHDRTDVSDGVDGSSS